VDQALQLFGLPDLVMASFAMQRPGARAVDWLHVVLSYGTRRVILHASVLVSGVVQRMAVHSTAGSWTKAGLDVQESQLLAGMTPGAPGWGEDPEPAVWCDGASGERIELPVPAGDYRQFYLRLAQAVSGTAASPVTPAEALAVMATIEAGIQAAGTGCACPLSLTDVERADFARGRG
jgi:predicted dehydrogenase